VCGQLVAVRTDLLKAGTMRREASVSLTHREPAWLQATSAVVDPAAAATQPRSVATAACRASALLAARVAEGLRALMQLTTSSTAASSWARRGGGEAVVSGCCM
jgi:hypothetical protein